MPEENQLTCHCPGPLVYVYAVASGWRFSSALIVNVAAAIFSTSAAVRRYPLGGTFCSVMRTGVFGSVAVTVAVEVTVLVMTEPAASARAGATAIPMAKAPRIAPTSSARTGAASPVAARANMLGRRPSTP